MLVATDWNYLNGVCHCGMQEIIDEFDNVRKVKAYIKEIDHGNIWYLAAEEIDADGNVTTATWEKNNKEALDRLKKSLYPPHKL